MRIAIVGLGVIGGSFAKGLKKLGHTIIGIDISPETLEFATKHSIIDEGYIEASQGIKNCDLVIIALYPSKIYPFICEHKDQFTKSMLLVDVSGVKSSYLHLVDATLAVDVDYISTHPMAGREQQGIMYSDDQIFKNANFIITPLKRNRIENLNLIKDIAKALEFKSITEIPPKEHDLKIAFTSQLTHAIAVSLMNSNHHHDIEHIIGDSFRDLTRIAMINETMWSELFLENQQALLENITLFQAQLDKLKSAVLNKDDATLKKMFIASTQKRKGLNRWP